MRSPPFVFPAPADETYRLRPDIVRLSPPMRTKPPTPSNRMLVQGVESPPVVGRAAGVATVGVAATVAATVGVATSVAATVGVAASVAATVGVTASVAATVGVIASVAATVGVTVAVACT